MDRWTRIVFTTALLAVSAMAISACSVLYDFDSECDSDSECERLDNTQPTNPVENEIYACEDQSCVLLPDAECRDDDDCSGDDVCTDNSCVPMNDEPDGGDADGGDTEEVIDNSCDSDDDCADGEACSEAGECAVLDCASGGNDYCTSTFGADSGCSTDSVCVATTCETTSYCIDNFGDSFYCTPSGSCVDTAAEGCEDIFYPDDADKDEVVILGTIIPTEAQGFTSVGPTIRNATRMAVIEYGDNGFDLPGGPIVAHLQCEGGTEANAESAARHMRDIEVPVIVGPLTSSNYIQAVQNVTGDEQDNPVVTISMSATSPTIGALNAAGSYSFQLIANDRFQSSALADRAEELKTRSCTEVQATECQNRSECRAAFGQDWEYDNSNLSEPCTDPSPKVNIFYKDDKYGNDLHDLTVTRFQDRYTEADVNSYKYPNPADLGFDPDTIAQRFGTIISDAVAENPDADINIFIGTGEGVQFAFSYISSLSGAGEDTTTRQYIFSHGAAADAPNIMEQFGTPEDYLPRIEAIAPNIFNSTDNLFEDWQSRYSATFQEPAQTTVGGLAYDAAFMSIFAMAGASLDREDNLAAVPVTPERVSQVLEEGWLQDASATQVPLKEVQTFTVTAKQQLGRGNNIDMVGVSGALNFTIDNGVNLGTIRSSYIGLDINSRTGPGGTIYEGVPTRLYLLTTGEVYGSWTDL